MKEKERRWEKGEKKQSVSQSRWEGRGGGGGGRFFSLKERGGGGGGGCGGRGGGVGEVLTPTVIDGITTGEEKEGKEGKEGKE